MRRSATRWQLDGPSRVALALLGTGLVAYVTWVLTGVGSPRIDDLMSTGVYDGLTVGAALLCLWRALRAGPERTAWLLVAAGLCSSAAGDVLDSILGSPASPAPPDALWVLAYPLLGSGFMLLAARRLGRVAVPVALDGIVAGLAVAGVAAAFLFDPIVGNATGGPLEIATVLAYPIADLALLAIAVSLFFAAGARFDRTFTPFGLGLVLWAVGDTLYLSQTAAGTYVAGTLLDATWPAAVYAMALAACQPSRRLHQATGLALVAVPVTFSLVAIGVLVVGRFEPVSVVGVALVAAALLAVLVRAAMTFRAYTTMLSSSRREAVTDALTGLGNRRRLMRDLELMFARAGGAPRRALVIFDLDGFKGYNDAFGHPAGDALLARLAARMRLAVGDDGAAYRMGGDEFCAVLPAREGSFDVGIAACVAALREQGDGFVIGSSHGAVVVPDEAGEAAEALARADERMYANKASRRGSADRQMRDLLIATLRESDPELVSAATGIAAVARGVATELGLTGESVDEIVRCAELHDIGKVAMPEALLRKPGPLDDREWDLMRSYTAVGERILAVAPAMRPVARLVRSTRERWDGAGYPDGLAGEDIPLGSRVVAVCAAFVAMTSERPYAAVRGEAEAVAELRSCAGTQFDPAVVEALARSLALARPAPVGPVGEHAGERAPGG